MVRLERRYPAGTLIIEDPAPAVMTVTLAELEAVPDLPPEEAQRVTDSIVFWDEETPAIQLTRAQWSLVLAERKRAGRPLDRADVLLLIEPKDGLNDDR